MEYARREAKRDAAITERWGTGIAAKLVRAVSVEPQSTTAWAIGAAGEEKLAAELASVSGIRMLHDRRVPGTRGNIDHIVIGPAGVFVIDAKNHRGRIAIRDRGGLLRSDYRLTVAGRDCSRLADDMTWQTDAVRISLVGHGFDPVPPVVAVLCFLNVEWPLLRPPNIFRGVRVESHRSIKRLVATPERLTAQDADRIAASLSASFPAK
jgi:hypothetical protein